MKTTAEIIKETLFGKTNMVMTHKKAPWEKEITESAGAWKILGLRMVVFKDQSALLIDDFAYDKAISLIKDYFKKKKAAERQDSKESRFLFISKCYITYGDANCTPALLEQAVYHFNDRKEFEQFILAYFNC